jgi:hypothetical protein
MDTADDSQGHLNSVAREQPAASTSSSELTPKRRRTDSSSKVARELKEDGEKVLRNEVGFWSEGTRLSISIM